MELFLPAAPPRIKLSLDLDKLIPRLLLLAIEGSGPISDSKDFKTS
jgi:hypothetical protein